MLTDALAAGREVILVDYPGVSSSAGTPARTRRFAGGGAGFSATAQVSRREFGIDISIPTDGGGVAVGGKVSVSLEIEAVLQK